MAMLPLLPSINHPLWQLNAARDEMVSKDPSAPNILILVFDALSATNMSLYGYPRATTPNLDRFSQKATVFHRHYAGGTFTTPGTASLLTGAYPWSHRAFHLYGTVDKKFEQQNVFQGLPADTYYRTTYTHNDLAAALLYQFRDDLDLFKKIYELSLYYEIPLADTLFEQDHNAAFLGERVIVRGQRGQSHQMPSSLLAGMLHKIWRTASKGSIQHQYRDLFPRGVPSTNAAPLFFLLEDAIDWVQAETNRKTPYLGYFHFFPPHEPYNTRHEFVNIFKDGWSPVSKPAHRFSDGIDQNTLDKQRRHYDEFIAYADAEFGRLYSYMEQENLLENTYIIVTSDHGEMFERGILEHITPTLYEPLVHIPLLISRPGQHQRIDVQDPTSCVDLLPTLYHITGQPEPAASDGQILPTFGERDPSPERSIFTMDAKSNPKMGPLVEGSVALIKGRYKLIHYLGSNDAALGYEFYDLEHDP
ncbi:MAG: sulfatase-like hydrolase/transferase, partial [Chloroflexota bacterium]